MRGKERQPSSKGTASSESSTISGLIRTCSLRPPGCPVSLNTISLIFTPTWGAAKPTPSSLCTSSELSVDCRSEQRLCKSAPVVHGLEQVCSKALQVAVKVRDVGVGRAQARVWVLYDLQRPLPLQLGCAHKTRSAALKHVHATAAHALTCSHVCEALCGGCSPALHALPLAGRQPARLAHPAGLLLRCVFVILAGCCVVGRGGQLLGWKSGWPHGSLHDYGGGVQPCTTERQSSAGETERGDGFCAQVVFVSHRHSALASQRWLPAARLYRAGK